MKLADNMPEDNPWTPTVRWLAHNLQIFPNAGVGFAYQIKHNIRGHGTNLMGDWYPRAVLVLLPGRSDDQADAARARCLLGGLLDRPAAIVLASARPGGAVAACCSR